MGEHDGACARRNLALEAVSSLGRAFCRAAQGVVNGQ